MSDCAKRLRAATIRRRWLMGFGYFYCVQATFFAIAAPTWWYFLSVPVTIAMIVHAYTTLTDTIAIIHATVEVERLIGEMEKTRAMMEAKR